MIEAGGRTICSDTQKLKNCIWNKEELPGELKESINVPIYQKGDRTYSSNYRGISVFSTTYKILSTILLPT